mmetsp:Transcript_4196/g.14182  ORF Transcript_4196/g.14182 Transcript_4196/m.14182 type:complete len:227 (+) Transcript_4196:742-1422(+)
MSATIFTGAATRQSVVRLPTSRTMRPDSGRRFTRTCTRALALMGSNGSAFSATMTTVVGCLPWVGTRPLATRGEQIFPPAPAVGSLPRSTTSERCVTPTSQWSTSLWTTMSSTRFAPRSSRTTTSAVLCTTWSMVRPAARQVLLRRRSSRTTTSAVLCTTWSMVRPAARRVQPRRRIAMIGSGDSGRQSKRGSSRRCPSPVLTGKSSWPTCLQRDHGARTSLRGWR